MAPMTVEELQQHPEFNHTIWDLKPEKKGKAVVAKDRGGPLNIAYEVHGHGDRHLVVSRPTFGINICSNMMRCISRQRKLVLDRDAFVMFLFYQSTGTGTLSPFRFSHNDRLNSSASCLRLSNSHTYTFRFIAASGIFRIHRYREDSTTDAM